MSLMDNLLSLFHVDAQVRGLRSRLQSAEKYLQTQNHQFEVLQQQRQELATRKKHLQASVANLEVELKSADQRLEKLRGELNSANTTKQYNALLTEVNTVKVARGECEDRLLAEIEQIEKIDQDLSGLGAQSAERSKIREVAASQLAARQADVGQRLAELETERHTAAAIIPTEHLATFEQVSDIHEGEALAPLEEISRRDREYACGSCNMSVPFELVSSLTTRRECLVRCPSCGRILYMQEEMRGTLAKK